MPHRLELLGRVQLLRDGRPIESIAGHRQKLAFLAYLALQPDLRAPRERIVGLLWPDRDETSARRSLSQLIYELRQEVGDLVHTSRASVGLDELEFECDAREFRKAAEAGDTARALELYAGHFLEGLSFSGSAEYEQWGDMERAQLQRLHRRVCREHVASLRDRGEIEAAMAAARRWLAADPFEDEAHHALIELLSLAGDRAGALEQFDRYVRLCREMEVEPLPDTRALAERIRAGEGVAVVREEPGSLLPRPVPAERPRAEAAREPVRAGWRPGLRWGKPALAAAAAVVATALVVLLGPWRDGGDGGPPMGSSVLVLPFAMPPAASGDTLALGPDLHRYLWRHLGEFERQGLWAIDAARLPGGGAEALDDPARAHEFARRVGTQYLVRGELVRSGDRVLLICDLYDVSTGERVLRTHRESSARDVDVVDLVAGSALDLYHEVAADQGWTLTPGSLPGLATRSPRAWSQLESGLAHFRRAQFEEAASAFRSAIATDTAFALAYFYLSLAEYWRLGPDAARHAVRQALARQDRLRPRELLLSRAHDAYMRGVVDTAITLYAEATQQYPDNTEGWLGLAEAYYHLGPYAGYAPRDAFRTFQRLVAVDSAFSLGYPHLVEMARLLGDSTAMAEYVGNFLALTQAEAASPQRLPRREYLRGLWIFEHGGPRERGEFVEALPRTPMPVLKRIFQELVRGGHDLSLADSVAAGLAHATRPPTERHEGEVLRFVALAALDRWEEAKDAWRRAVQAGADPRYNPWVVMSFVAAYPADSLALPMLTFVRTKMEADPTWPDSTLSDLDEPWRQYRGLAQYAAVAGDSALVRIVGDRLLRRPPDSPLTRSLRGALDARLALLAADTSAAMEALRGGLDYVDEPLTGFFPTTVFGPQRILLARLLLERGEADEARRWLESFEWSTAILDALFLRESRALKSRILQGAPE